MRKMQKIAALGLAGTMALSLAACGGSGDSTADTASTAESTASSTEATAESTGSGDEAVTLNWALWDKDSTAYWQALADGYMESHPNVTIEMTDLGSTDYMTQLATQLAGGNGELDVLSIKDIPGYSNLINLGMLEPLSGKLTTDESKFNGVLEQLTADMIPTGIIYWARMIWVLQFACAVPGRITESSFVRYWCRWILPRRFIGGRNSIHTRLRPLRIRQAQCIRFTASRSRLTISATTICRMRHLARWIRLWIFSNNSV